MQVTKRFAHFSPLVLWLSALVILHPVRLTAQEPDLSNYEGTWLKNDSAEAFISHKPFIRVVVFRLKGGESPIRFVEGKPEPYTGVKTWVMSPEQNDKAWLMGRLEGKIVEKGSLSLEITSKIYHPEKIQVRWKVQLDPQKPVLKIQHGLVNKGYTSRQLAPWAIVALEKKGFGVVPWSSGSEPRHYSAKRIQFWNDSHPAHAIHLGEQAWLIDFKTPLKKNMAKAGGRTNSGEIIYLNDHLALISHGEYQTHHQYPEGDCNVTTYMGGKDPSIGFCEIENVAPIQTVARNQTAWLKHRLELVPLLEDANSLSSLPKDEIADKALEMTDLARSGRWITNSSIKRTLSNYPLILGFIASSQLSTNPTHSQEPQVGKLAAGLKVLEWSDLSATGVHARSGSRNESPKVTETGLNFSKGMLKLDHSAIIQTGGPYQNRTWYFEFQTSTDIESRQVIYEQGGGATGLNLFIENGKIFGSIYNQIGSQKAEPHEIWGPVVHAKELQANTSYRAALLFGEDLTWKLWLNGEEIASTQIPTPLHKHGDSSAIGGVSRFTRFPQEGQVNADKGFPYHGTLKALLIFDKALSSGELDGLAEALQLNP